MRRSLVAALLTLWMLGSPLVFAQEQETVRPRVSARALLQDAPIAGSFDALLPLLHEGHEVVVTDRHGRRRRGTVVTISPDAIILKSPVAAGGWEAALPLYWPLDLGLVLKRQLSRPTERTYSNDVVTRIDIVDPTGNGTTIGAAVGLSLTAGTFLWERRQPPSNLKGFVTALALMVGLPVSVRMGHVIDRATNDPIYERARPATRVSMVPLLGRSSGGVAVVLDW